MPINGKPLLSIWLETLTNAGYGPFLINSHYLHKQIENFTINSDFKNNILLSYEKEILGTAGTLMRNLQFLEEGGLLAHADNFCLANFREFFQKHQARPKNCMMTMMTFKTTRPELCGIVELDKNNIVTKFYEKDSNKRGNIANGAIYLLSKEMVKELGKNYKNCNDFSTEIIPEFLSKIYTYHTDKPLVDIGTIEDYHLANQIFKEYEFK